VPPLIEPADAAGLVLQRPRDDHLVGVVGPLPEVVVEVELDGGGLVLDESSTMFLYRNGV